MLSARNIDKFFTLNEERIQVLRDVSLDIEDGEFLSIMGRSGSGKTTLLNVLSTLVQPDDGQVLYQGEDITNGKDGRVNDLRSSDFAVIFQFHHLIPYLSVLQNTLLPFMGGVKRVSKDRVTQAESCLDRLGLEDKKHRLPGNLSGGEQQRVAIARAMVKSSKVLFADEPTGSLDRSTGEQIMSLLKELNREGLTVVMVTHESIYAEQADRVVQIADGRIV